MLGTTVLGCLGVPQIGFLQDPLATAAKPQVINPRSLADVRHHASSSVQIP